ncbi:MAG: bifunctional demethylmenaquinone methyltransferase/2-methoxy-6-polyprenyl-1,4-benzoquinol methylase UbiE [Muribaculaceae bacterium]|nr:bifunctional demethylmenaquinone methyltransferase/2-methoxy-6-polyprenyl-1,4-benzoquinol methylase UbiE [Muribaculaceae bacterium]
MAPTQNTTTKSPGEGAELITPYDHDRHKGEQVEQMFDSIAPAYDLMNTAMTFGLHNIWRSKALRAAFAAHGDSAPDRILDIATGTGDVVFELNKMAPDAQVIGVDISTGMLEVASRKLSQASESTRKHVSFQQGDSLALSFDDNSFDLVTVAYGVRNFEKLEQGLKEIARVLKPGGTLCIIELSEPENKFLKFGYRLYSRNMIPMVGRMVSGDSRAYTYLPESIAAAPQRDDLTAIMKRAGLKDASWKSLTMGAVTYYIASK